VIDEIAGVDHVKAQATVEKLSLTRTGQRRHQEIIVSSLIAPLLIAHKRAVFVLILPSIVSRECSTKLNHAAPS
jgi:hypothetical protein